MSLGATLGDVFNQAREGDVEGARLRLDGVAIGVPRSRRDRLIALCAIHDLWLSPLPVIGAAVELQLDGRIIELKASLERCLVAELEEATRGWPMDLDAMPADAMRRLAAVDLLPPLYRWLGLGADREELIGYLAIEGGPDGGFDDLVAICQVGMAGRAKVELGRNYWDEMGRGELARVHTNMHDAMVAALDLDVPERDQLPVEALARSALGSMLATNRALQPEMIGMLGFIELQAGPRSREVAKGLRRVGAPVEALPFYDEHATADPRHGRAWLDEVVTPLAGELPSWGSRMLHGARWRAAVNREFFGWAERRFMPDREAVRDELIGMAT